MFEIERKFLLSKPLQEVLDAYPTMPVQHIKQQYLHNTGAWAIRIRTVTKLGRDRCYLTLKRPTKGLFLNGDDIYLQDNGMTAIEHEVEIPQEKYGAMSMCAGPALIKTRYSVLFDDLVWEIDEFHSPGLKGLFLVEVELSSADQKIRLPNWVGKEVTEDYEYKNVKLVEKITA